MFTLGFKYSSDLMKIIIGRHNVSELNIVDCLVHPKIVFKGYNNFILDSQYDTSLGNKKLHKYI